VLSMLFLLVQPLSSETSFPPRTCGMTGAGEVFSHLDGVFGPDIDLWTSINGDHHEGEACVTIGKCTWKHVHLPEEAMTTLSDGASCEKGHFIPAGHGSPSQTATCVASGLDRKDASVLPSTDFASVADSGECSQKSATLLQGTEPQKHRWLWLPVDVGVGCLSVVLDIDVRSRLVVASPTCEDEYFRDVNITSPAGPAIAAVFDGGAFTVPVEERQEGMWVLSQDAPYATKGVDEHALRLWISSVRSTAGTAKAVPIEVQGQQVTGNTNPTSLSLLWLAAAASRLNVAPPAKSNIPIVASPKGSPEWLARDWMIRMVLANGIASSGTLLRFECVRRDWIERGGNACP